MALGGVVLAGRRGPVRWRVAGRLDARLPELWGRDQVVGWVRGPVDRYGGPLAGRLANGMSFDVASCRDGSARALSALRYREPALAPVFEAVLRPGDTCYDVGANIGVYTLWAAGLVGRWGQVHAFEPVPPTMAVLREMVQRNGLGQVVPVASAIGATVGQTGLRSYQGASGRAHAVADPSHADHFARLDTLDAYVARHRPPDLVKIDVAGAEIDVLRGATELLEDRAPALLLEMLTSRVARRGGTPGQAELVGRLLDAGYVLFNLTPNGPVANGRFTSNVLAIAPRWDRFDRVVAALARVPFPRSQPI
ncbi:MULTISPECIES: FkbM family methyltransferase [unclassified Frankia]|uniref:FkbM family methyltransferase n=1 Tax=unclassified Frankia TaxID=2632575 RepID=UPI001EE49EAE|nr:MULTISPECIES: FkbM family methyltransferase [unclassified Frankia]